MITHVVDIAEKAKADYANARGRRIYISTLQAYNAKKAHSVEVLLRTPMPFVVIDTPEDDVVRRMDKDIIDSVWNIAPEGDYSELEGLEAFWVYAKTYYANGDTSSGDVIMFGQAKI